MRAALFVSSLADIVCYIAEVIDRAQLLNDLTPEQREAAMHVDGPLLIIAGAGSGKTRVITRRVVHLISLGIPAHSIVAITFTNKAAGEMKDRVGKVLGRQLYDFGKLDQRWPTVCTFHSLCLRILRHYAPIIKLPANFTIFDSGDQSKLVKDALKMLDISSTNFSPGTIHAAISNAKNKLLTAELYARTAADFYSKTVARVYTKYQQLLATNNALDFDDLLLKTAAAFRDHPEILRELQERFQYILIDEYQDTNHAQYVIAHAMAMRHRNMCVVGDPDQSIYAWRGADIQNILDFEKDYPDAKVVRLERNYRSTKTILAIASQLIARNRLRKDKTLWTENAQGSRAKLFLCQDERDEAQVVAEQLRALNEQGVAWSRMAIFYRMNSLSRVMEDALRNANMPYVMARGVEFYNRKEIKDTLAYLRVIANPADEVALMRIVNVPTRGIGDASVKQMQAWGVGNGTNLWGAMEQATKISGLSARAVNSVRSFVELVASWRRIASVTIKPDAEVEGDAPGSSVSIARDENTLFVSSTIRDEAGEELAGEESAVEGPGASLSASFSGLEVSLPSKGLVTRLMEDVVRRSGLEGMLKKDKTGEETGESGLDNINSLITSAAEYDAGNPEASLTEYLSMVSLVSDADHMKGSGGAITMMTLHAAKGLEFPVVAMIGLEEGILPHSRSRGNATELEEERRLCFVGITRAQEHLILSKAAYRTIRGLRERTVGSPFLNEMPQDAVELIDRTELDFGRDRSTQKRLADIEAESRVGRFRKGQLVRHPMFGLGRIAEVDDMGPQARAVVEFNAVGRKTLILQHARLEPVA